jgi:hypothetical protein
MVVCLASSALAGPSRATSFDCSARPFSEARGPCQSEQIVMPSVYVEINRSRRNNGPSPPGLYVRPSSCRWEAQSWPRLQEIVVETDVSVTKKPR